MAVGQGGDGSRTSGRRRRGRRSQRGKLRKELSIDHVTVEEPFALHHPLGGATGAVADAATGAPSVGLGFDEESVTTCGEGCYVTATVNSRKYYGVLVDQPALQAASLLHFQNEAGGLDLNRRMRALRRAADEKQQQEQILDDDGEEQLQQHHQEAKLDGGEEQMPVQQQKAMVDDGNPNDTEADRCRKRSASDDDELEDNNDNSGKRPKGRHIGSVAGITSRIQNPPVTASAAAASIPPTFPQRQVQKFRYDEDGIRGYRTLLATYADVAAAGEDDTAKQKAIHDACDDGGNYVGKYYYQYEVCTGVFFVLSSRPALRV